MAALLSQRGHVVPWLRLYDMTYGDNAVEPAQLYWHINRMRRRLGRDVIRTAPRRGVYIL